MAKFCLGSTLTTDRGLETDHGSLMFEDVLQERRFAGGQQIKQIIAKRVSVLLQEPLCTVIHNACKVDNPEGPHLTGLGLHVVIIGSVLTVQFIQHGLVSTL